MLVENFPKPHSMSFIWGAIRTLRCFALRRNKFSAEKLASNFELTDKSLIYILQIYILQIYVKHAKNSNFFP